MVLHGHTTFSLGKAEKTEREVQGKMTRMMKRDILTGGRIIGKLEIPGGGVVDFGHLRDADDTIILRWEKPARTRVEFAFYDRLDTPKGSLRMTSGLLSKNREFEIRDSRNNLLMKFNGTDKKMTKEKNAGIFSDLQENIVGRTWTKWKDPATGAKGPFIEALAHQDLILASLLPLVRHTMFHPNKY